MSRKARSGDEKRTSSRRTSTPGNTAVFDFPIWPLGERSRLVRDNAYVLERGHVFTSASVARKVTMSCYAMLVLTAQGAPFLVQVGREARPYRAVAIKPPMERAIFADNVRLTSIHLNPLHPKFRCFRTIGGSGVLELPREAFACVDAELDKAYEGLLDITDAERLFETVIAIAGAFLPEPPPLDPRIATIVRMLDAGKEYSLKDLAAKVRLSANRMTHLFTESIGIPLRSYLLWRKIHRVPILLASGKSFTAVAHECGFTDSAHLATAFQNLYGASPTYFFNSNHVRLLSWLRS